MVYSLPRFASRFSSMLVCSSRIASRMLASDKSRSVLVVNLASVIVGEGRELPFVTEGAFANVFETIDRLFMSVKDGSIATLAVGSVGVGFTASDATVSLGVISSSSLLGSCGSAGFNGKAGDSSFGLMENDTDAKHKIGMLDTISAMHTVAPY